MATVGWAKDATSPAEDARLGAFLAAGGNVTDLCGGAGDSPLHDHGVCGLCPAGMGAWLPATPSVMPLPRLVSLVTVARPALDLLARPPRHPAWSGRAPPLA